MSVAIFKPDEIGDFILSTGAIRLLTREHGEENTTLVVKDEIVPLARQEFPDANIVGLPWQPKRKGHSRTIANLRHCFPVWRRLRRLCVDDSVSLRARRDYVQTVLFAASRAPRRFAAENPLVRKGKPRRQIVEAFLVHLAHPRLLPYPCPAVELGVPSELASFRAIVAAMLGREVASDEVMPRLSTVQWRGGGGWLLCPFSSNPVKDYSAGRWADSLREAMKTVSPRGIQLAGSPAQWEALREFADSLRAAGVTCAVEVLPPGPLEKFPDLVANADLVLTVDTAAAHFACASGAPAVIVACGLNSGIYGPYSPNGRQIWLVGDYARLRARGWQESVPSDAVAAAIRRASGDA